MTQGCYLLEDVPELCAAGLMDLWLIGKGEEVIGAAVAQLVTYPQKRVIEVRFIGAKPNTLEEWRNILPKAIEESGKAVGATASSCIGRMGWGRVLGDGAKEIARVFWRDFAAAEQQEAA